MTDTFSSHVYDCITNWYNMQHTTNFDIEQLSIQEKIDTETLVNTCFNNIIKQLSKFPDDEKDRIEWAKNINKLAMNSLSIPSIDKKNVIKYFTEKGIMSATKDFMSKAKDEKLNVESLGQAIRNAWIMNILQLIFSKDIKCTNSIFAYSMLYPYSDNYIDSDLDHIIKKKYNKLFRERLEGKKNTPQNECEQNIYRMIDLIEGDFNRDKYKNVYDSLILIHDAQTNSQKQHETSLPFENDILNITFTKGAASVVADGYLLDGDMTEDELNFTVSFGIALQLCDDITDITSDTDEGSATIYSLCTSSGKPLDVLAIMTLNFIDYYYKNSLDTFKFEKDKDVFEFMRKCCYYLALAGIIKNRKYFSKDFVKTAELYFPVRAAFMSKFMKGMRKDISGALSKYDKETKDLMFDYIGRYWE